MIIQRTDICLLIFVLYNNHYIIELVNINDIFNQSLKSLKSLKYKNVYLKRIYRK